MKDKKKKSIEYYATWIIVVSGVLFLISYALYGVIEYVYFYNGI